MRCMALASSPLQMANGLGPVVAPIVRAKSAHIDAGHALDRLASVRRESATAPVADCLRRLSKRLGQCSEAAGFSHYFVKQRLFGHSPILNDSFSARQQFVGASSHTLFMDSVWNRVKDEAERRAKGRWQQWLTDRLTDISDKPYSIQRVQNWKTRGVPRGEYPSLALALGKSIDWVAGLEASERIPEPDQFDMAADAAATLRAIDDLALRRRVYARWVSLAHEMVEDAPRPNTAKSAPGDKLTP